MIGSLKIKKDADGTPSGQGPFVTLDYNMTLAIVPSDGDVSGNRPTHHVTCKGRRHNGRVQIGSAWWKEIESGEMAGDHRFSITLDDPSFTRPIYLSAIPIHKGADEFELVFNRPSEKPAGEGQGA